MLSEIYVTVFHILLCVRRLRGTEGVVVIGVFFNNSLAQVSEDSISVGLHSQQSNLSLFPTKFLLSMGEKICHAM